MNPLCSRGRRLRAPVVLIVAGLLAVAAPGGQPAGPPDPTPERGMTETLDVDLKADPRPRFEVRGAVAWEAGKLTLNSGGKLRRKVAVGSDARLTLALTFAPLDTDGQKSTTRFAFQVRDRGEFVAVMTRQRADGRTKASVRLVDQDTPFQMADVTRTIRTFELDGDLPSGAWTFRHHHGLVTVYCDGTRIGVGYSDKEPGQYSGNPRSQLPNNPEFYRYFGVDEPLEVAGWRLEQQGVPLVCGAISGAASESYKAKLAASFPEKARKYGRAVKAFSPSEENGDLRARTEGPLTGGANREFLHFEGPTTDYRELMIRDCLGERHPYYALVLLGRGLQLQWDRRDEPARALLEKAVAVSEEALGPGHPSRISAESALGKYYREHGRFDRAAALLEKAVDGSTETFGRGHARSTAAVRELARLYQQTGRVADAEALLAGKSAAPGKDAPPRQRATDLLARADQQVQVGEREKAAALYAQAVQVLAPLSNTARPDPGALVDLARARARYAWSLRTAGRTDDARKHAREAFLNMVQFHGAEPSRPGRFPGWNSDMRNVQPNGLVVGQPDYCRVMIGLADLFVGLGDHAPARACVSVSDLVSESVTSRHDNAVLYRTTARLYEREPNLEFGLWVGKLSERQRLDTVVKRYRANTDADEADRQKLIASAQMARPTDKLADDEYRRISQKLRVPVGLPPGSQPKGRPPNHARDWWPIARREFEAVSGPEHPETVEVLLSQGRWLWQGGGPAAAEPVFHDAAARTVAFAGRVLPGLPEVETYSFAEAGRPALDLLLSCSRDVRADRASEAYEAVWQSKGLATRAVTERRELLQAAATGRPELKRLAADLQATRQRLASVSLAPPSRDVKARQAELAELNGRKEDLEREAAGLSKELRKSQEVARAGVADTLRRLPPGTAVVDFVERRRWAPPATRAGEWRSARTYDAFVVRPAAGEPSWSAVWLDLGDADEIDRSVEEWVTALRSVRDARPLAEKVGRRVWSPLAAALAGCTTVVVVPDGALALVPWAALPGSRPDSYLVEDYALAQVPYGQHLARVLTDAAPAGEGALLVGGIDYGDGGKWKSLPGTAVEVEELAALRPAKDTVRLGGANAGKARLTELLPGRRYVHLATHGEFLDAAPDRDRQQFLVIDSASGGAVLDVTARNPLLLSMLVLAGANRPARTDASGLPLGSDGFLTAEEVMGLDLTRTELVVLSACETGLGRVRGGEGVFSLQRAFHVGGCRSVVASLWQIPDKPTQVFMQRFYDNLWNKKMSKLEALRAAQVWMLREGARQPELMRGLKRVLPGETPTKEGGPLPPFYWAAFTLSGDWR